jgi:hypothetical protein
MIEHRPGDPMTYLQSARSRPSWIAACAFAALATTSNMTHAQDASDAFDGRWTTTLVCDDTHDKDKFVKGYTFIFPVVVQHGHLAGQYGQQDAPSSVTFSGQIEANGTADISATGRTGSNEYVMGTAGKGVVYGYRMRGTFDSTSGHATRTSVRPCSASFARQ